MNRFSRVVSFVAALSAAAAMAAPVRAADGAEPRVVVYKSPDCGCCANWVEHLRSSGFVVDARNVPDIDAVKLLAGVPEDLAACHTATIAGYVVEGHVPARDIRRLLEEKPAANGIAVPGMPAGSPGMEQGGARDSYAVVLYSGKTRSVFARY